MKLDFFARYKKSQIVRNVTLWYLTILLVLIFTGIIASPFVLRLEKIAKDFYFHPYSVSKSAIELRHNTLETKSIMFQILLTEDKQEIQKYFNRILMIETLMDANISLIQKKFLGDKSKVEELKNLLKEWRLIRQSELDLVRRGKLYYTPKISNVSNDVLYNKIDELNLYIIDFANNKAYSFVLESEEIIKKIILILFALILFILISGFFTLEKSILLQKKEDQIESLNREKFLKLTRIRIEQELANKKSELQIIADNVPVNISMVNEKLEFQFVNKTFAETFQVSPEFCKGVHVKEIIGESIFEKVYLNYQKALKGETVIYVNNFDMKDGKNKFFEIRYTPFIEKNQVTGVIILSQDITATKLSEINLIKAKEEAEIANRLKSEFLANMSHEIRTPMNAILGFSEILKDKVGNNPIILDYLSGIQKSGKNLINLINDILDLAKIEAGRLEIVYSPVNLLTLIQEVKQIFTLQTSNKKINFEIWVDDKLPKSLLLDELRLRQVLFNLIGNSVKFTERGGIKVSVLSIPKGGESSSIDLVIEIEDTGIGIADFELETIFEPFRQQRGQDANKFGGSGLGLSITKKLVSMMGGTISVESKLGVGSKFSVKVRDLEISSLVQKSLDYESEIYAITFDEPKILLVEDMESNRKVVTGFLENHNFKITEAQNGKIALEILEKNSFDLILMDMQMPELDGKETTLAIKKNERFKSLPILILTASAMKENVEEILSFADGYLSKPITRYELINELAKFLPHKKNETDNNLFASISGDFYSEMQDFIKQNPLDDNFTEEFDNWFMVTESVRKSLNTKKLLQSIMDLQTLSKKYNITPLTNFTLNLFRLIQNFSISEIIEELHTLELVYKMLNNKLSEK